MRERIERAEIYNDPAVENDFHGDVILHEDLARQRRMARRISGRRWGCYMTIFAGPKAERRARDYFNALKTGALKTVRDGPLEH